MPDHDHTLTGEVADIFAHRFVIATRDGRFLADLGPKGAEQIALREGDRVTVTGEMKPSEMKVHTIQRGDSPAIALEHKKPPRRPQAHEPEPAGVR